MNEENTQTPPPAEDQTNSKPPRKPKKAPTTCRLEIENVAGVFVDHGEFKSPEAAYDAAPTLLTVEGEFPARTLRILDEFITSMKTTTTVERKAVRAPGRRKPRR